MKTILYCLLFAVMGTQSFAQKVIEKQFAYQDQVIDLDVSFARTITVNSWDKPNVYFKASINIEDPQFLTYYKVDFEETNGLITIREAAGPLFEAMRDYGRKNDAGNRCYWYNTGDICQFHYVLYVPKNATVQLESINGDLSSENLIGNFKTALVNGDIELSTYAGNLNLETVNGTIDLKVDDVSFTAKTVNGDIYANENLAMTIYDKNVGQRIESTEQDHSTQLRLNTVNGNMYLRK
ncbi:MAG: DUF4097 family beta strand repeat-containing protein [Bacteroidota bacterium]